MKRGFTLIELLVVVAIIALLISILLPSLRAAREQAKAAVCGSQLRSLGTGLASYASEQNGYIPGTNTSGVAVRALKSSPADSFRKAGLPAQSYDWITPWMGLETDMGASPVDKYRIILNQYSCPSQRGTNAIIYASGIDSDLLNEFEEKGPWTSLSYLMPIHFQRWGERYRGRRLASLERISFLPVTAEVYNTDWEVSNEDYVSRFENVGRLADRKIAAADGTRYLTSEGILDFDGDPTPGVFGSFTSSGAWWAGSTAYGPRSGTPNWSGGNVGSGSVGNGENLELSYRHGTSRGAQSGGSAVNNQGQINALFFDGHIARLTDKESRNPEYWYPSGTKITQPQEGMTEVRPNTADPLFIVP